MEWNECATFRRPVGTSALCQGTQASEELAHVHAQRADGTSLNKAAAGQSKTAECLCHADGSFPTYFFRSFFFCTVFLTSAVLV